MAGERNSNSFEILGNLSARVTQTDSDEYMQKGGSKASKRRRKKTRSTGETFSVSFNPNGTQSMSFQPQQTGSLDEEFLSEPVYEEILSMPPRGSQTLNRMMSDEVGNTKEAPSPSLEPASMPGSPCRSPFPTRPALTSFDDIVHTSPSFTSDAPGTPNLAFLNSHFSPSPSALQTPPLATLVHASTVASQAFLSPSPSRVPEPGPVPRSAPRSGANGVTASPQTAARFGGASASPLAPAAVPSSAATPQQSPGKVASGTPARRTTWTSSMTGPHAWPSSRGRTGDATPWEEEGQSSFWDYMWVELNPMPSYPTTDVVWGQTERQRVYNAILYVPYQLERLILYELLVCLDTFLAMFTILPVRFVVAVLQLAVRGLGQRMGRGPAAGSSASEGPPVTGAQLFDILCVAIFALTIAFLQMVNAGSIYYWMKDLTREFLKLQVIHAVLEILDRILLSFIVDSLEALSGTCTLYVSEEKSWQGVRQVVADWVVSATLIIVHALVIMCQGMTFSVAMNSKRGSALVALLIASSFVEIKVGVFKRYDTRALFNLTCQDAIERFHMCLALLFVLVEEMDNSGVWAHLEALLWRCVAILSSEVAIDVIKHAVISKFNDMRPGLYRELFKDVCEKARAGNSHTARRIIAFDPFAPAAFAVRIAFTAGAALRATAPSGGISGLRLWACGSIAWLVLLVTKVVLGFGLRATAASYLYHYDLTHAGKSRTTARLPAPKPDGKKLE
eukprot:jgi/Botrbrau1/13055/Bobra.0187s0017.1